MQKQLHVKHGLEINPADAAGENLNIYTVTKVTNSTRPVIGQRFSDEELQVYCELDDWNVSVT